MTYCVAVKLNDGLVFCSDSRTNAGVDHVNSYSKLHRFDGFADRKFFLLSAGNLGTTQAVVKAMRRDLESGAEFNLLTANTTTEVADYVGRLSVQMQQKYAQGGPMAGFDASASFIVGGQIQGRDADIYMVYPEGNHIGASKNHPFLQIGETKYGKPILVRAHDPDMTFEEAIRLMLVSFDSTIKANLSVDLPLDLQTYKKDSLNVGHVDRIEFSHPYYQLISNQWGESLKSALDALPDYSIKDQT